MTQEPLYITTPIYYVNDVPHLGHAYTTLVADAFARYGRARGRPTRLLTGTDEHGQKIEEAARAAGLEPRAQADRVVERFLSTWKKLGISNDDFIRTTEPRHARVVQALWQRIAERGDIYLGDYEDWYCVPCEAFYTETQLEPGRLCPIHKREVTRIKEQSYFFRMSKYEKPLIEHFERHPGFVRPEMRRNEVLSFIRGGLRDLSISRKGLRWGIPVPGDPEHVIYVWVDALTNYMSALGGWGTPLFDEFWPHAVHLIGKDILRFHAVYWPTLLLSAGLPLPRAVVTHGWWTVRGEKISKSLPATRIDPNRIADDLGTDGLRYFLLREVPLGLDGDFVPDSVFLRWNSDLANDFGNLVHRTIGMAKGELAEGGKDPSIERLAQTVRQRVEQSIDAFEPSKALEAIWELIRGANQFIAEKEPFRAAPADRSKILSVVAEAIRWSTLMVQPVLPDTAQAIMGQLGLKGAVLETTWPDFFGYPGSRPGKAEPLFPKIDEPRAAELVSHWLPETASVAPPVAAPVSGPPQTISFADFEKLDLRIGEIKEARKHPQAERLLHLSVDAGEGRLRSIVAGIAQSYEPEALVGARVLLLCNLPSKKIRGVLSEGMVLAAGADTGISLLLPGRPVPPGTRVK